MDAKAVDLLFWENIVILVSTVIGPVVEVQLEFSDN